jgi:hypothetical protein
MHLLMEAKEILEQPITGPSRLGWKFYCSEAGIQIQSGDAARSGQKRSGRFKLQTGARLPPNLKKAQVK